MELRQVNNAPRIEVDRVEDSFKSEESIDNFEN